MFTNERQLTLSHDRTGPSFIYMLRDLSGPAAASTRRCSLAAVDLAMAGAAAAADNLDSAGGHYE